MTIRHAIRVDFLGDERNFTLVMGKLPSKVLAICASAHEFWTLQDGHTG